MSPLIFTASPSPTASTPATASSTSGDMRICRGSGGWGENRVAGLLGAPPRAHDRPASEALSNLATQQPSNPATRISIQQTPLRRKVDGMGEASLSRRWRQSVEFDRQNCTPVGRDHRAGLPPLEPVQY